MITKYTISNDPNLYEAWPDVALTDDDSMVCVFSECTHHHDRSYTRIMLTESRDRGRTWTPKHPLAEGTAGKNYYYNCARINRLKNGRLAIIIDRIPAAGENTKDTETMNLLFFSSDNGSTWSEPLETPLNGIVPDKLTELDNGRWLISAHRRFDQKLTQFLHYSDDQGKTWSDAVTVAHDPALNLCEISLLPLGNGSVVGFMRENSACGYDCKKVISYDNGETWSQIIDFPLSGCHRPTSGLLQSGNIMITYRYHQGGKSGWGNCTQNFFAAFTDRESTLAEERRQSRARIVPIDYDRSPKSDLGYSGWVQFPDGEIYIVNYIVDDAIDKGQIRGYSLFEKDIMLTS